MSPDSQSEQACKESHEKNLGQCKKCCALVVLKNTPVPMGVEDRAKKTIPDGVLEIKASAIHGFGVFATRALPEGVQMGPYEGETGNMEDIGMYMWQLSNGKMIDGADETKSNWLRYVNCSRNIHEQNLQVFEFDDNIFFKIIKEIQPGKELLVFYGKSYAQILLHIDLDCYFKPSISHHGRDLYSCRYCFIKYLVKTTRDRHENTCVLNKSKETGSKFECKFCGVNLTTETYLNQHERRCKKKIDQEMDRAEYPYQCTECNFASKYKTSYYIHMRKHNQSGNHVKKKVPATDVNKRFSCDKCHFSTAHSSSLRKHKLTHDPVKRFRCKFCQKCISQRYNLKLHIMSQHPDLCDEKMRLYHCDKCSYKSGHSSQFRRHQRIHTDAKKFSCSFCGYASFDKGALDRHLDTHSGIKPFHCDYCKKSFGQLRHLNLHIRTVHKTVEK